MTVGQPVPDPLRDSAKSSAVSAIDEILEICSKLTVQITNDRIADPLGCLVTLYSLASLSRAGIIMNGSRKGVTCIPLDGKSLLLLLPPYPRGEMSVNPCARARF